MVTGRSSFSLTSTSSTALLTGGFLTYHHACDTKWINGIVISYGRSYWHNGKCGTMDAKS